ncbi:MAG: hypothetical protein EON58_10485 [Alphaproteobacteria bacterium]|nr:MAG: hypothetical protein EON58_10485 [Alphaproteobacteria bacterium]
MSLQKVTAESVYNAIVSIRRMGKRDSADAIVEITGGSKSTVLNLRREAYQRLKEEGLAIDPTAGFLALTDPLIRKIWSVARQQAELAASKQVEILSANIATLEDDVERLAAWEDRATKAESRVAELEAQNKTLNSQLLDLVTTFAEGKSRKETPTKSEIGAVLRAVRDLKGRPTHDELYREMQDKKWSAAAAQKARFKVMAAGYLEPALEISAKGQSWLEKNPQA